MTAKTTKTNKKTPAIKIDTKLLLPLACLLLGLIIMTVMYFQQSSKLTAANEQLIAVGATLTAETAACEAAEVQNAALTAELDAANAALADSTARLEECESVLTTALEAIQLMRGEFAAE